MLTRRTGYVCATSAIVALLAASRSMADTGDYVTMDFTGYSLARLAYVTCDHRSFMTAVGLSTFCVDDQSGSYGGLGQELVSSSPGRVATGYSMSLLPGVSLGQEYTVSLEDPSEASVIPAGRMKDVQSLIDNYAGKVADADTAAAFAAALLEIIYETATKSVNGQIVPAYNVDTGVFHMRPATGENWDVLANTWLNDLGADPPVTDTLVGTGIGGSDFMFRCSDSRTVPEPLTAAGFLLGLGGVGVYVRNRFRRCSPDA